ncbi:MAG: glycosyltransferase family 2 protein, partial [Candidatus Hodarchaeota archaeon]
FEWVVELLKALEKQTIEDFKVIIIVNGNMRYFRKLSNVVKNEIEAIYEIQVVFNPTDKGIAHSRNIALEYAKTPYIAYTDDDAIPHARWLEELLSALEQNRKVGAVTGPVLCKWEQDTEDYASWFPEELYWIIGCTSRKINRLTVVRNGFASNLALKRKILLKTGGFNEDLGYSQRNLIAGEETELGIKLLRAGYVTVWNPKAIIFHRIFKERLRMSNILTRSFVEGKTKAYINQRYGSGVIKTEANHLQSIVKHFIKTRSFKSKALLLNTTIAVLSGYLAYRALRFQ